MICFYIKTKSLKATGSWPLCLLLSITDITQILIKRKTPWMWPSVHYSLCVSYFCPQYVHSAVVPVQEKNRTWHDYQEEHDPYPKACILSHRFPDLLRGTSLVENGTKWAKITALLKLNNNLLIFIYPSASYSSHSNTSLTRPLGTWINVLNTFLIPMCCVYSGTTV